MPDAAPAPPSLASRIAIAVASGGTGHGARTGVVVAMLLAGAPLAVWAGARWTAAGVRRDIAAITVIARPRLAILTARERARGELAPLLVTPGVATTLDGLAEALPTDARLTRAARGSSRRLSVDVQATDPDRLRAALRRDPATARLRDAGQRRSDGGLTVSLEDAR